MKYDNELLSTIEQLESKAHKQMDNDFWNGNVGARLYDVGYLQGIRDVLNEIR